MIYESNPQARGDAAAGGATTIRELTPSSGRDDDGNAAADRHGTSEQMQPPPPRDTRAPDPSRPSGVAELRGDDDTAAGQMPQTQQVAEGASAAAAMAAMAYRPGASSDRSAGTISPPPGGGGPDHELAEDDHHAAGHLGVLNANGQIMNGNSHMMSRPRGRAPRGKAWSEAAGEWLDDGSLGHQPTSGVTRPRGRAPRGKSWDRVGGIWINEQVPANQYGLGGHGGQPGESAAAARMQHHPQSGGGMPQYAIGAGAMQIMQQQGSGATQGANGQPIQMVSASLLRRNQHPPPSNTIQHHSTPFNPGPVCFEGVLFDCVLMHCLTFGLRPCPCPPLPSLPAPLSRPPADAASCPRSHSRPK